MKNTVKYNNTCNTRMSKCTKYDLKSLDDSKVTHYIMKILKTRVLKWILVELQTSQDMKMCSRNTNRRSFISQIAVEQIDITRGKSKINELMEK
jgi:hypothetical protein